MTEKKIQIVCGDRLLNELGNNNCDFISLISEFIDNVAAELIHCIEAEIKITIGGPWVTGTKGRKSLDLSKSFIEIEDNGPGISFENLSTALSLANTTNQMGLHEHGLGMKTAIVSLGELDYLVTKSKDDLIAHRVEKLLAQGDLQVYEDPNFDKIGTKIRIKNLKAKVKKRKEEYTTTVVDHLGARYSNLLTGTLNKKKIKIIVQLQDENGKIVQDSNGQEAYWDIKPHFPIYQNNRPLINKELKGKDWSAHLEFGFAPDESEYEQYNIEKPAKHHPYEQWAKKIDIIMHDRILKRVNLSDLQLKYADAYFAPFVGRLTLRHGFKTSMTKDGVLHDENWEELITQVQELCEPIIKSRVHTKKCVQDESFYRDKLYNIQKFGEEKEVYKEFPVEGCDGHIDLVVEKECWELKAEQATGKDVYQVLYYIDNYENAIQNSGRLIAPDFSEGCKFAAKNLMKKRGINIKLKTFKEVGLEDI